MANNFKRGIDRMMWVQVAPTPSTHSAGSGMACDLRNDLSRSPFMYQLVSNTVLNRYNIVTKAWNLVVSPALAGTFGAGAGAVFVPSLGLKSTISTGSTASKITTSTVQANVAPNMLANRGGSGEYGFKVRVTSVSSGKVEERWITGNTGGTTPTINLDTPLTFTPASGDTIEILAGRVFMLGSGTTASGTWKSFELSFNALASKSTTNLPATISSDFSAVALDEQYVPFDRLPGEGFVVGTSTYDGTSKKCLVATATGASSITGQATGGDASLLANEYRNFQIRIVEDTANKTAVGQRRIIASHTGGASPVYTLGTAWSVQPSANAKFVIEYPNLIILRNSATTTMYTYNYSTDVVNNGTNSINGDAWSTTYFAVAGNAHGTGVTMFPSFGIEPDVDKNARHSYVYCFRGGASTALDLFDIAGGTTGAWTNGIVYDGAGMAYVSTGSCGKYAPFDNDGKFGYMNVYVASAINQIYRFDVKNRVLSSFVPTDWVQSGTSATGDRLGAICLLDGEDKYTMLLLIAHLSTIDQEIIVQS